MKECPVCCKKATYDGLIKHLRMSKDEDHRGLSFKLSETNPKINLGRKEIKDVKP
ncbi:hypothetical protein IC007_0930 [Sulfuracidifex tepidarius]|uniref:Uncharacterized protein n=1 Tax=Sulfuracidifex tepidarius TaxID=1294262 RepID=A0A510E1Q8_9CREN|nr:hypothetical protein IC007_0930 [Sulfuracidifex tepidarius]